MAVLWTCQRTVPSQSYLKVKKADFIAADLPNLPLGRAGERSFKNRLNI